MAVQRLLLCFLCGCMLVAALPVTPLWSRQIPLGPNATDTNLYPSASGQFLCALGWNASAPANNLMCLDAYSGSVFGSIPISDDEEFDVLSSCVVVVNRATRNMTYYYVGTAWWSPFWSKLLPSFSAPTNVIEVGERYLMIGVGKNILVINRDNGDVSFTTAVQRGDLVSVNITDGGYIVAKAHQPNATYLYGYRLEGGVLKQLWDYSRPCESLEFTFVDGNIIASVVSGAQTWFVVLSIENGAVLVDAKTPYFRGPFISSRAMVYIPAITAYNLQASRVWASTQYVAHGIVTYCSVLDVLAVCPTAPQPPLPGVVFLDPLTGAVVGSLPISFSMRCLSAFWAGTQVASTEGKTLMFVRVQAWNGTSIALGYQYGSAQRRF